MNFELSEEQKMIQQSVERFVQENYDLPKRVEISSKDPGYSKDYWGSMAELGWLGLPFNEEDGGFGGNQIDTLVIMEQFGKGLVLEPFLANVVLGGGAIQMGGSEELKKEISEYIATEKLERSLQTLLEAMQRSINDDNQNEIGVWVSGFYGSGKSSFTCL